MIDACKVNQAVCRAVVAAFKFEKFVAATVPADGLAANSSCRLSRLVLITAPHFHTNAIGRLASLPRLRWCGTVLDSWQLPIRTILSTFVYIHFLIF